MSALSNETKFSLSDLPDALRAIAAEVSREIAHARGPAGGFSLVEHAWHLADLERAGFAVRIARLTTEDAPELPDFDGDLAARHGRYDERELAAGIDAFAAARAENVARLAAAPGDAWARAGTQEGVGRVTLADLPARMLGHDRAHAREIADLLAAIATACTVLPHIERIARAADPQLGAA